jgi:hypothetical protein
VQNAIGGFRDSGIYPFDINRVDMSKLASSKLWKCNQHNTVSGPTHEVQDTAIMRGTDSAGTDLSQASSHQAFDKSTSQTTTACSDLVERFDDEPEAETSVIVDPAVIDWNMDLEVDTDEAGNMYITLPPLSSERGLLESSALPSSDQTQLLDKSVALTSSSEHFHPEHEKIYEEEPSKDVANNTMSLAFDEVLSIPTMKSKTNKVSPIPYPKALSGTDMINYLQEKKHEKEQAVVKKNQRKMEREEKRKQRQIDVANKKALIAERKQHRACVKLQKEENKTSTEYQREEGQKETEPIIHITIIHQWA